MKYSILILLLLIALLPKTSDAWPRWPSWHHQSQSQEVNVNECSQGRRYVDQSTKGEIIEGSACIITAVNPLHYRTRIVQEITESAGKDLTSIFPPQQGPKVQESPENVTPLKNASTSSLELMKKPAQGIDEQFKAIVDSINATDEAFFQQQKQVRNAKATEIAEIQTLKGLVDSSDTMLLGQDHEALAKNLISQDQTAVSGFQELSWPDIETTLATLDNLHQQLEKLKSDKDWPNWYKDVNKQAYDDAVQRVKSMSDAAEAIAPGAAEYTNFAAQYAAVQSWTRYIQALKPEMFFAAAPIECGALFNVSRSHALKILQTDLSATLDLKPLPSDTTIDNWVTVRCSNPFTLSAGTVFSLISDQEFQSVQSKSTDANGNPTTVNKFQVTSTSDIPILPIALVHARIWDLPHHVVALHISFGVAAHTRSDAEGGSNPEYLLGGSISILRTLFVTGGPYWGRSTALGGGFSVNDVVPSGVGSAPIVTNSQRAWAISVSLTKP